MTCTISRVFAALKSSSSYGSAFIAFHSYVPCEASGQHKPLQSVPM